MTTFQLVILQIHLTLLCITILGASAIIGAAINNLARTIKETNNE